jgi:hypothetical protein
MWQLHPIAFSIPAAGLILNQFVCVVCQHIQCRAGHFALDCLGDQTHSQQMQKLQELLAIKEKDQYIVMMGPREWVKWFCCNQLLPCGQC